MESPVGINFRSSGFSTILSDNIAFKSIPAEADVLYSGKGCDDLFTMLIFITKWSLELSDKSKHKKRE